MVGYWRRSKALWLCEQSVNRIFPTTSLRARATGGAALVVVHLLTIILIFSNTTVLHSSKSTCRCAGPRLFDQGAFWLPSFLSSNFLFASFHGLYNHALPLDSFGFAYGLHSINPYFLQERSAAQPFCFMRASAIVFSSP